MNFDLPKTIDEYVHRIGRTGRVGNRGLATSFYDPLCDSHLAPALVKILSQAGQEIPDFLLEFKETEIGFGTSNFGGSDYRVIIFILIFFFFLSNFKVIFVYINKFFLIE